MKLNRREKILVFVLLYFGILAGSFQLFLKPMFTEYTENKAKFVEVQAQRKDVEMLIAQEGMYESQINKSISNIEEEVKYYPSSIDMEKTHSLLSVIGKDFGLTLTNLTVPEYESVVEIQTTADVPATQLKKTTIDIEFEGTYEGVAKYIDKIDSFDKAMRIAELVIEPVKSISGTSNKVVAAFKIDIYTVPRKDTEGFYTYKFPNAPGIMRESGGF